MQIVQISDLRKIPVKLRGDSILSLKTNERKRLLLKLDNGEIVRIIKHLDPSDTIDLLRSVGAKRRNTIIGELDKQARKRIESILKLDVDKVSEILCQNYIEIEVSNTVLQVSDKINKFERKKGRVPVVLAMDEKGNLIGEIPVRSILNAGSDEVVSAYVKKIRYFDKRKKNSEIRHVFEKHPNGKVVLLGNEGDVLGIVFADDLLKLLKANGSKSLQRFAGVRKQEDALDSSLWKVRYRSHWLVVNLFTAFLAASIVGLFESTISRMVLLAAYLPIVAGMGGNAATQTLAVTVRGMALGKINKDNAKKIILNESLAGIMNGFITGLIAAIIAYLWNGNFMLGVVIGLAMIFNLLIAGFFGTLIPLIMDKFGKDPASSATIFITTSTDVFGFLAFLGLANLILV